jgi:hypothetical protein
LRIDCLVAQLEGRNFEVSDREWEIVGGWDFG